MAICKCCWKVFTDTPQRSQHCGACYEHRRRNRLRGVITQCRHGRKPKPPGKPGSGRMIVMGDQ